MTDHDDVTTDPGLLPEHQPGRKVAKVKLLVIIDQANGMLEWKVTGIKGDPPRSSFLADGGGDAGHQDAHLRVVMAHIGRLLEEYCEPF